MTSLALLPPAPAPATPFPGAMPSVPANDPPPPSDPTEDGRHASAPDAQTTDDRRRTTDASQAARNRLNAAKSTGPRTPAGKRRSAQNARTHGLAATLLMEESRRIHEGNQHKAAEAKCQTTPTPANPRQTTPINAPAQNEPTVLTSPRSVSSVSSVSSVAEHPLPDARQGATPRNTAQQNTPPAQNEPTPRLPLSPPHPGPINPPLPTLPLNPYPQ